MKQLSDTLGAILSEMATPKEPSRGLTTNDGQISQLQAVRQNPLTEAQLTAIASSALQQPLTIVIEEKKIYGRKKISDEYGEYYTDDEVIGSKSSVDCMIDLKTSVTTQMLESALMFSPKSAYIKHVTHLIMHKKMGSNDIDRTIMVNDYIQGLQGYPEFVVYQVCRYYWENDRRPFVPFIAEIKEACDIFTNTLKGHLQKIKNLKENKTPRIIEAFKKVEPEWVPPTEQEKANVHDIIEQCIKNLSGA